MRKKALLAAMMALVLLLSGCALIVKDEAVDNATEIIRMGDQVITKKEDQGLGGQGPGSLVLREEATGAQTKGNWVLGKVELPELLELREDDTGDLNCLESWEKGNLSTSPHFFSY